MSDIKYNTGAALLNNVKADFDLITGGNGETRVYGGGSKSVSNQGGALSGSNGGSNPLLNGVKSFLEGLSDLLDSVADMIGNAGGSPSAPVQNEPSVISGTGKIWGDPHFIGADGGKYDVQGEAGKTYNLLSDENFQMNGRFDSWGSGGATVVGKVGISAGSDQVEVNKDGSVMVNGQELANGERVELANGGYVKKNGNEVIVESGEWKVDFDVRKGSHLNMDVSTDNAIADGVKPHGLLGQTFDGDGKARNGDKGRGAQGGGAIEGADGEMTSNGDKSAVEMYEVDGLYDRNFETFNQFFDDADRGFFNEEVNQILANAFAAIGESMTAFSNVMQSARGVA